MLFSDYCSLDSEILKQQGVFDPVMDQDSHFFINLQRLKHTEVQEFRNSYERIQDYFRRIIKLLSKASSKTIADPFYKQALKLFHFSEVNGICLGYAKSTKGAGFGSILSGQVISTAFEIVKSGVEDPEFFELLPLFQDNIGADRLCDMMATLILEDIESYTKRVNKQLGIVSNIKTNYETDGEFIVNPYKKERVLLVPIDILHKLPIAETWGEVQYAAFQNNAIRSEMNSFVAAEWTTYTSSQKKEIIREDVFLNPNACKKVLASYKAERLEAFNPYSDSEYCTAKMLQDVFRYVTQFVTTIPEHDSLSVSMRIIKFFKKWVEDNKGWEFIVTIGSSKREKIVQRVFHGFALCFINANNLDISCEPDEGRGPADFKVSRGCDKTIIEIKLSTNDQYLHGYEHQIEEYGKAENTSNLIYMLIDLGNPNRIKRVMELHDKRYNDGENIPELVIIDSKRKQSASKDMDK